jgi:hypothetical protein
MNEVAKLLDMAPIRVYEIATFYTMFQLKPRGKYLLQVCTTTPCWLRGSEAVMKACQHAADGEIFSVQEVECLGGCVNAPVFTDIQLEIDVDARRGRVYVEDYIDTVGAPIRNKVTGVEARAQIVLPAGFEYTVADIGSASSKTQGPVRVELKDTYGQFARLHLNSHGVVRA